MTYEQISPVESNSMTSFEGRISAFDYLKLDVEFWRSKRELFRENPAIKQLLSVFGHGPKHKAARIHSNDVARVSHALSGEIGEEWAVKYDITLHQLRTVIMAAVLVHDVGKTRNDVRRVTLSELRYSEMEE